MPGMIPEDIVFLRGAQEEILRNLLQLQLAPQPTDVFNWMIANDIAYTLEAYGESEEETRRYIREGTLATTKWTNRLRAILKKLTPPIQAFEKSSAALKSNMVESL